MPGTIGSTAPGTRTNPAEKTSVSSDSSSESSQGPTLPKPGMTQNEDQEGEEDPAPSVIRRAHLPSPSEVEDDKVYMATFESGNTVPMTGRELKETLTTEQPPGMGQAANGQTGGTQGGTSTGGSSGGVDDRSVWVDVLLGIGQIGGIFLRDQIGSGRSLSPQERQALQRIAQRRRQERLRRQRRNRWLLVGGVVVVGGLGIWLATRSSSSAPPPPPPPPPEDEPGGEGSDFEEPEGVEITDAERERVNQSSTGEGQPEDLASNQ